MTLGIRIGEIGSKLGMNSTNNGFLAFDQVRIPRMNMLMKNAQVLEVNNCLIFLCTLVLCIGKVSFILYDSPVFKE